MFLYTSRGIGLVVLFAFFGATTVSTLQAADKLSKKDKRWLEEEVAAIITQHEAAMFKDISKDDRKLFKELFWARRDHNPMTPANEAQQAYEQRVSFVNKNFEVRGRKGAATDMGKVFLLLGDPTEREQSGGRGRGDRNRAGDGSGGREDPDRRPSGGGGPGVGTGGGRGDSGNRAQMQTWVYTPNEALGIPNGLTVRFRSQQNLGFRIIQSDELEEALERSKTRFIRNPSINYELNADGRLMKLEGRADPNSPAKLILQEFRDTRMATEDIRFEPDFAFFQSNRGNTYIAILLSVDGTPLTWNDNEAAVEIFYSIEDADGFPISQTEEPVTLAQSQQGPVTVELPIQLRPGDYTVYFGIRDVGTETYGTQIVPLSVPDFTQDELKLSTTVLFTDGEKTDDLVPQIGKAFLVGEYHFIPKQGTSFAKTDAIRAVFNVYGYGIPDGADPNLTMQFVFSQDGARRGQTKNSPVPASSVVAIGVMDVPLSSFEPGKYSVQLRVTDHVKNEVVTEDIAFEIVGDESR